MEKSFAIKMIVLTAIFWVIGLVIGISTGNIIAALICVYIAGAIPFTFLRMNDSKPESGQGCAYVVGFYFGKILISFLCAVVTYVYYFVQAIISLK